MGEYGERWEGMHWPVPSLQSKLNTDRQKESISTEDGIKSNCVSIQLVNYPPDHLPSKFTAGAAQVESK